MKLFSFATIVAAAGIAQVLAVPLLVVPSNDVVATPIHHGFAGKPEVVAKMKKGPCRASRYRQKAVEVSNIFREALGLPLIKTGIHHLKLDGKVQILPFIGSSNTIVHSKDKEGTVIKVGTFDMPKDDGRVHRHGYHTHGRHRHHKGHGIGKGSFISRIHYSIMNLGPWEGRSVAFVLGCGIGVLLRMLFVLTVVMFRAVKGQRREEEEHEYSQITIIEEFVDSPKSSPPSYVDEKVSVEVETVQAPAPSYVNENYPVPTESVKAPTTPEELK